MSAAGSIRIDINADLGEGPGPGPLEDDTAMLEVVSSANVACGFHAGDPSMMRSVCHAAAARGVAIGAHVSYQDLAGFGRRFIDIDATKLRDSVTYQIGALEAFARAAGARVGYVKPHGALYNAIVHHQSQADAVVAGVHAFGALPLMGLPGSLGLAIAESAGLPTVREAFVDRAYNADGTLVSRRHAGAVLHDVDQIVNRTVRMVCEGTVTAIDGTEIDIAAESVCVHGDTPGAVRIAASVRRALESAGVSVRSFIG